MGRSRVVESDGYTEENSARTGSGGRIRDPGLFQAISWDDWFYKELLCVAGTPVYCAERAYPLFSVSADQGPSSVNKVLCGTPLPDR